jgi:hypothetical protein
VTAWLMLCGRPVQSTLVPPVPLAMNLPATFSVTVTDSYAVDPAGQVNLTGAKTTAPLASRVAVSPSLSTDEGGDLLIKAAPAGSANATTAPQSDGGGGEQGGVSAGGWRVPSRGGARAEPD